MKPLGLVRQLDSLGRLVIPAELRETLDMGPRQPLEFFATRSGIFIRKYDPGQGIPKDDEIESVRL